MILFKERFSGDFRLYDTKTGKYVQNNPETRSRALFSYLVMNEVKKAQKGAKKEDLYSVTELANIYGKTTYEFRGLEKVARLQYEAFEYVLERRFGAEKLLKRNIIKQLAFHVLQDQQDEYSMTNIFDVETLKNDYGYMNKEIFKNVEEKTL